MSEHDEKQDGQWLDALAGHPDPGADSKVNAESAAVRRALLARKQRLDEEVPPASDAGFERLLFRLKREGLLAEGPRSASSAQRRRHWTWGLAAAVLITAGLSIPLLQLLVEDTAITRGPGATILIVENPEQRAAELVAGIRAAGQEASTTRLDGGRIKLRAKATPEVLDYLATQRIEPTLVDSHSKPVSPSPPSQPTAGGAEQWVELLLEPPSSRKR